MLMPEPDQESLAKRDAIVAALREIVPGEGVVVTPEEMRAYECDGLTAYRAVPMAVVLPSTVEQVSAVLRLCDRERIKVVPAGPGPRSRAGRCRSPTASCWRWASSTASWTSTSRTGR
jgi:glycolate oxidase